MSLLERLGLRREPVARVVMRVSYDTLVAGESYDVPVELADRIVVRGYADGSLSREYSPEELAALRGNPQVVNPVG